MPNHITSIVHIESRYEDDDQSDYEERKADLEKLWKDLHTDESEFDFNAILPQPEGIYRGNLSSEDQVKHPLNWYDWNIKNWGTKWNAYSVVYLSGAEVDELYDEILVKIETAWAPPVPVLEALAKRFDVRFTWKDEGANEWHNWEKIKDS